MIRARRVPIACAGLCVALACAGPGAPPRQPRAEGERISLPALSGPSKRPAHLVLVSIAGLTADRYRRDGARAPAMPTLAALAEAGVSADAVESVAPAAAYPAHATLISGELPAAHGIPADLRLGKRGVRATPYWHASHLRVPTLWQLAAQSKLRVAALGWPSTVGASIPLLLSDIVPTRRGETWLGVQESSATPWVLEVARHRGGAAAEADRPGAARDSVLVATACDILKSPPALLLLHLSQTGPVLAEHGPGSPEAQAAFRRADGAIARLLDCLTDAGAIGASALVVVGDHGVLPVHTRIAPNTVLAREGLLTPGGEGKGEIARWSAIARSNGGSAFVYAVGETGAVRARRALAAAAERTRAFRVVSAEEMLSLGADPDAWFGLEAEPGFAFGDSAAGPLLRPEARRGVGGYLPHRAEMSAGFVAWGRGLRSGVRILAMRQTDVAPTVARLLGLDLGEVNGRVLVGALSRPEAAGPADRERGGGR